MGEGFGSERKARSRVLSERQRDGEVQRSAEVEKSREGGEKESDLRRSADCKAQEQASASLYLWQAPAQALQEMAPSA